MKVMVPTYKDVIDKIDPKTFTGLLASIEEYNNLAFNKKDTYEVSNRLDREFWNANQYLLVDGFTKTNRAFKLDRYYRNNIAQYSLVANAPVARVILAALCSQAVWGSEDTQIIC